MFCSCRGFYAPNIVRKSRGLDVPVAVAGTMSKSTFASAARRRRAGVWLRCPCAPVPPRRGHFPASIHELWQRPADVATRDLFSGIGGAELAPGPNSRFEFVEEDTTGASPGYTARDENGTEWDIKLGEEVQPEVVLLRLLWAVGYHQPPTYYVPAGWTIAGAPASVKIAAGPQGHARFRPDRAGQQVVGDWSGRSRKKSDRGWR